MLRLVRRFFGRGSSPAAAPPPPEPLQPKQDILNPSSVGIPEGVYHLVYENDDCNSRFGTCLSTSLELAVYGRDLDYTLVVPVKRKSQKDEDGEWELKYIPKIQEAKVWNCPISEITPGNIAEIFFTELYNKQRRLPREPPSHDERCPEDHPTLWYETGLENVVWHRYTEIQEPGEFSKTRRMTEQRWN